MSYLLPNWDSETGLHTGNYVADGDTDFPPEYCSCGHECVPGEYKCAICIEDSEKDKETEL